MSALAWAITGGILVSLLWMFVVAALLDRIAWHRRALAYTQTSLRLYRDSREESNRQVGALLDQNARLARQIIDEAAGSTATAVVAMPHDFFQPGRES